MSEYFSLHRVLDSSSDSQAKILKENILYYLDNDKKQDFIYGYAKKECLFFNDQICLYLKRYQLDKSACFSLNYPKRKSQVYHSQSINFDHLSQAKVRQQSTLILLTTFLTQIVFIFQNSQIANQWCDLINQKIKENRCNKKKKYQDQINLNSIQQTIKNLTVKIDIKNYEIKQLKEVITQKNQIIAQLQKKNDEKIFQLDNNCSFLTRNSQINQETLIEMGNANAKNEEQTFSIISYLFEQIKKKNQLLTAFRQRWDNNFTRQLTRSNFITNEQDLKWHMANKLSRILRKDPHEIYILIRS